jgi:hypothetical protein
VGELEVGVSWADRGVILLTPGQLLRTWGSSQACDLRMSRRMRKRRDLAMERGTSEEEEMN